MRSERNKEGIPFIPLNAELRAVDLKQGRVLFHPLEGGEDFEGDRWLACPEKLSWWKPFLARMNGFLAEGGEPGHGDRPPRQGVLLVPPWSDEEGRLKPLDPCWVKAFVPERTREDYLPFVVGEVVAFKRGRLILRLANGNRLTVRSQEPEETKEILQVFLDVNALAKGMLQASRVRVAQGKTALEYLKRRELTGGLEPAILLDQNEHGGRIHFGEVALLYGPAKTGKTRASLALTASGEPREHGIEVVRNLQIVDGTPVYYLSHITETSLLLLRKYAHQLGWDDEAIENRLYPFEKLSQLLGFLDDPEIPERSVVIVDSLVKLLPLGRAGRSENDAVTIEEALKPLVTRARLRRHVIIVLHHASRANQGPRGSTAIEALVDHILRLEKPQRGAQRLIYERGRTEAPKTPLIIFKDERWESGQEHSPTTPVKGKTGRPNVWWPEIASVLRKLKDEGKVTRLNDYPDQEFFLEKDILAGLSKRGRARGLSPRELRQKLAYQARNAKPQNLIRLEVGGDVYYAAAEGAMERALSASPKRSRRGQGKKSSR